MSGENPGSIQQQLDMDYPEHQEGTEGFWPDGEDLAIGGG